LLVGVNRNRLPTSFLASHAHTHTHTRFRPKRAREEEKEETEGEKGILSFSSFLSGALPKKKRKKKKKEKKEKNYFSLNCSTKQQNTFTSHLLALCT